MRTYGQRNELLLGMGYATYQDYLASPLWEGIKVRLFRGLKKDRCCCCPNPGEEWHHVTYSKASLTGTDLKDIVRVCRTCHKRIEFTRGGRKRTLEAAIALFRKMFARRDKMKARRLLPEYRKGLKGWCSVCGRKAKSNIRFCKPCLIRLRRQCR